MKKKIGLCLFGALLASSALANRPIVFLHGWNSDGGIWSNMKSLLRSNAGYAESDLYAFTYCDSTLYNSSFGYSKSTPIETVAEGVAREITEIYYESGHPVDLVTHSMGGLVVRAMLAYDLIDTKCIGKFISLAAPHYGQNIDLDIAGKQARQMKYGSLFLWELADAWHFKGKQIKETLCIAGAAQSVNSSKWDGLVHVWSAALGDTPCRYVNCVHSPAVGKEATVGTGMGAVAGAVIAGPIGAIFGALFGRKVGKSTINNIIYKCTKGMNDDVYVLVQNYLSWGWAYPQEYLSYSPASSITSNGGFFFQILDAANEPARYKSSDACLVHTYWHVENGKRIIADYLEHGDDDNESQYKGVELVYGTMPKGTYNLTAYASKMTPAFTAYGVPVQGGRMTVVRLRSSDGKVFRKLAKLAFDSMGGSPVAAQERYVGDYVNALPPSVLEGHQFYGWFTSPIGGSKIGANSIVTSNGLSLYAHWTKNDVQPTESNPSGGHAGFLSPSGETIPSHDEFNAWVSTHGHTAAYTSLKSQTINGAICTLDGNVCGTVELKIGAVNSKKKVKVSGTVCCLDGKRYRIIKAPMTIKENSPAIAKLAVKGFGTLEIAIGDDGILGVIGNEYIVQSAQVGGSWAKTDSCVNIDFNTDNTPPDAICDLLPYSEPILASKGKWAFAKTSLKTSKVKGGGYKLAYPDNVANPSAMKIKYSPKTGTFKGTFRLYTGTADNAKSSTVTITGVVVDGAGFGRASQKSPAAIWNVIAE